MFTKLDLDGNGTV